MFHIIQGKKFLTGVTIAATVLQLLPFGAFAQVTGTKIPAPIPASAPATTDHPAATQQTSQPSGGSTAQPAPSSGGGSASQSSAATKSGGAGTQIDTGGLTAGPATGGATQKPSHTVTAAVPKSLLDAITAIPSGFARLKNIQGANGQPLTQVVAERAGAVINLTFTPANGLTIANAYYQSGGFLGFGSSKSPCAASGNDVACTVPTSSGGGSIHFDVMPPKGPGDTGADSGYAGAVPPAGGAGAKRPGPAEVKAEIKNELEALMRGWRNSEVPAPSLEEGKDKFWPPISADGPFTLSKIATGEVKVKDELCKELNALYDNLRQNIYDSDMAPAEKSDALMAFSLAPEDRCDVSKVTAALFDAFQVPAEGGGTKLQVKVRGLAALLVNLNAQANALDNLAANIGTRAANIVYGLGDPAANRKAKEALLNSLRQGANAYNGSKSLLVLYGLGLKSKRLLTDPGFFENIMDQIADIVSDQERGRLTEMAKNDVLNTGHVSQNTQDEIDAAQKRAADAGR